jgi:hypothetical protein
MNCYKKYKKLENKCHNVIIYTNILLINGVI